MSFVLRLDRRSSVQCTGWYHTGPFVILPPACRTGLWFLITLLLLTPAPVHAEWVAVDKHYQSPGLQTVYVDSATIRRDGSLVTMVSLIDWTWMQGNRSPSRFFSTETKKQFDCAQKRLRLLAYSEFSKPMGTGRRNDGYVDQDHWLPVRPETIDHALWEMACSKG